jgi:hypothetical protein
MYLKECKLGYNKDTCTPRFIAVLFTIAKLWKQTRCPTTDEWINKMWYLYTMEFYSAIKKNKIFSFAWHWWLTPVNLATQEMEIRRTAV